MNNLGRALGDHPLHHYTSWVTWPQAITAARVGHRRNQQRAMMTRLGASLFNQPRRKRARTAKNSLHARRTGRRATGSSAAYPILWSLLRHPARIVRHVTSRFRHNYRSETSHLEIQPHVRPAGRARGLRHRPLPPASLRGTPVASHGAVRRRHRHG